MRVIKRATEKVINVAEATQWTSMLFPKITGKHASGKKNTKSN